MPADAHVPANAKHARNLELIGDGGAVIGGFIDERDPRDRAPGIERLLKERQPVPDGPV
jgi:hypothetical protein